MKRSLALLGILGLLPLRLLADDPALGHPDFVPTPEHPVGFRGDGTGCFPGATPVTDWQDRYGPELGKNVVWKTAMPNRSNSSPIVVGRKVFTLADPDLLICVDALTGKILWQKQVDHLVLWPADEAKKAREAWNKELAILNSFWTTGQELAFVSGAFRENMGVEKQVPALSLPDSATRKERIEKLRLDRAWTFETSGLRQGYDLNWNMYKFDKHHALTDEEVKKRLTIRLELFTKYGFNFEQWRGWLGHTFRTPTSDGQYVYVAMGFGQVACFDLNGELQWMQFLHPGGRDYQPGKDLKHPAQECGHCPSPILAGDVLIVHGKGYGSGKEGSKNRVVGLDKKSGKVLWEVRTGNLKRDVGSPQVMKLGGQDLIVLSTGVVLKGSDGTVLSEDAIQTPSTRIANLAIDGDRVFYNWCVSTDGKHDENYVDAFRFAIRPSGFVSTKLWRAAVPNCDRVGPTLHDGLIYVGGSSFYSVNAPDGAVTELFNDNKRRRCDGNTPPSVAGGKVFWVAGHEGKVLVTSAGVDAKVLSTNTMRIDVREDYDRLRANKISLDDYLKKYGGEEDRFPTVYAMCGGPFFQGSRMYLRTTEYLYCIGTR